MAQKVSLLSLISVSSEAIASAIEPALRKGGLSLSLFQLLMAVRAGRGKLTQAKLAANLGITPPSLCELIRSASQKDLVAQLPNPKDKRAKLIALTPKGEESLTDAIRLIESYDKQIRKQLDEDDWQTTIRTLQLVSTLIGDR